MSIDAAREALALLHAAVVGPTVELVLSAHSNGLGQADKRTREYVGQVGVFADDAFCDDAFFTEGFIEKKAQDEIRVMEDILGCAFVMAQTSIKRVANSTRALNALAKSSTIAQKTVHELMRWPGHERQAPPYSKIELIDAVANWWKHREEWPCDWAEITTRQARETAQRIASLGISSNTPGKLLEIVGHFGLSAPSAQMTSNLAPLWALVRQWAEAVETAVWDEFSVLYSDLRRD